jgi:small-conductance mechanosensitive channel
VTRHSLPCRILARWITEPRNLQFAFVGHHAIVGCNPMGDYLYRKSESRISYLTLLLGVLTALPVAYVHSWRWGVGIFIGSFLAWCNFRWLKQGADALTEAATAQANQKKVRVPLVTYFTAAFRYGLIALTVYVIFRYLNVPVLSMVVGLCALGAATIVVSVHSILRPSDYEWKKR